MNVRQRQPRLEDPAHLAYVRTLPCTICGRPGSDPAHLRTGSLEYGKRDTGMGEKSDDCWVLPLCRHHHDEQHGTNELRWWASYGIADPFALAAETYASRPGADKPPVERRKRTPKIEPRKPKSERRLVKGRTKIQQRLRIKAKAQHSATRPIVKYGNAPEQEKDETV